MSSFLMSRFSDVPALVAPERATWFTSCFNSFEGSPHSVDLYVASVMGSNKFWHEPDDWRAAFQPYNVNEGILHIPVAGVLVNGFKYAFGSAITGYDYIGRAFDRGMNDPDVRGIALVIDSPGGEVAGNFDLVDRMFARRGEKPVRAFAAESAYSAAYSIASVADHITVSRTGGVGSVGVVTTHVDHSEAMAAEGVKVTFIHYGKHKVDGNPYESLKPEVKDRIQARINELGEVFVATVARNRNMETQSIRDTEALTFTASEGVSNGLADSVGPLDEAMAAFAAELSLIGVIEMSTIKDNAAVVDTAAVDAARAEGVAAGRTEGTQTERDRITTIIGSAAAADRPKAAMSAALKTDMTVDQALAFLADLPSEKAVAVEPKAEVGKSDFDKVMAKDNPEVGTGRDVAETDVDTASYAIASARQMGLPGFRS
jgi:capsid assembly protease